MPLDNASLVGYGFPHVTCHVCGTEFVHLTGEPIMEQSDSYPAHGLGMRGSYLAVPMYCENGEHRFMLVVQEHKGNTFIGTRLLP